MFIYLNWLLTRFNPQLHHLHVRTAMEIFMFAVKCKDEHHQDGHITMMPKAEEFLVNIYKLEPEKVTRDFEMYVLCNIKGQLLYSLEHVGEG
jgi:hypothetical protein